MKVKIILLALLFILCCSACGSESERMTEDVQTTGLPTLAQSESLTAEVLRERLKGLTPEELCDLWGEPDDQLSGFWGEVWLVGDNTRITVYYDANGAVEEVLKRPVYDWGVTLTAKDVTPKGLTIVCTQSGGEPTGELSTGSYYTVQCMEDGAWKTVEYTAVDPDMVAWTTEGWLIPPESTLEWKVDWSWLYNELPAGEYRIGKSVMDWRAPGDYDEVMLYAEFTVE